MRRILSTLLLVLLVVCAQQAALVHEIGHGVGQGSGKPVAARDIAGSQDPGTTDKGSYCDKCFQFAHVSGATSGPAQTFVFDTAADDPAHGHQPAELAAEAPVSRSRGPPIVL